MVFFPQSYCMLFLLYRQKSQLLKSDKIEPLIVCIYPTHSCKQDRKQGQFLNSLTGLNSKFFFY